MSEHDLLETGSDFLKKGLEALNGDTQDSLRLGLLYFWTGIELLLKARLIETHWTLVFADTDAADRSSYKSGNFVSVDFNSSIKRLRGACGVSIKDEDVSRLKQVWSQRNKLMHFGLLDSRESLMAVLADAMDFLFHGYLPRAFPREKFDDVAEIARDLDEFVKLRWSKIQEIIDSAKSGGNFILRCAACKQVAGVIRKGVLDCKFCGQQEDDNHVILETNSANPPIKVTDYDRHDGCCFDVILELGSTDGDGIYEPEIFVCCVCGKHGQDLESIYTKDELCYCGEIADHEHD